MAAFGSGVPDEVESGVGLKRRVRSWCCRCGRPGADILDEDALAALVTHDHMIGVVR